MQADTESNANSPQGNAKDVAALIGNLRSGIDKLERDLALSSVASVEQRAHVDWAAYDVLDFKLADLDCILKALIELTGYEDDVERNFAAVGYLVHHASDVVAATRETFNDLLAAGRRSLGTEAAP